jgi:hypothetical protein
MSEFSIISKPSVDFWIDVTVLLDIDECLNLIEQVRVGIIYHFIVNLLKNSYSKYNF